MTAATDIADRLPAFEVSLDVTLSITIRMLNDKSSLQYKKICNVV